MTVLVTGATGLIGNALVLELVRRGEKVRALVRDPVRAAPLCPDVALVRGDVTDPGPGARGPSRTSSSSSVSESDGSRLGRIPRSASTGPLPPATTDGGVERLLGAELVLTVARRWTFQAPQGGSVTVNVPLNFAPAATFPTPAPSTTA